LQLRTDLTKEMQKIGSNEDIDINQRKIENKFNQQLQSLEN